MSSREVIGRLLREGWYLDRISGSHHKHPSRPTGLVVVPHPKKDLPPGTVRSIKKAAGWSD